MVFGHVLGIYDAYNNIWMQKCLAKQNIPNTYQKKQNYI